MVGVGPWTLFLPVDPKPTLSQSRVPLSPAQCPLTQLTTVLAPSQAQGISGQRQRSQTPAQSACVLLMLNARCHPASHLQGTSECLHVTIPSTHRPTNIKCVTSWHGPLALDDRQHPQLSLATGCWAGRGRGRALPLVGREDLRGMLEEPVLSPVTLQTHSKG